ncbi:hypothetical protein K3495_g7089 [Podosphaera aphanis]|nr:hypothetical protein K3495_g7089 [Podosphaera aphanis]
MEQGAHQYFADFVQDFEHRLAQCNEVYTAPGKTMQLKASINGKLRRPLIGVKLPLDENYDAWVAEVREVALDLESLADYRTRGANQTTTQFEAPKSGTAQGVSIRLETDADGDIRMGGTNALLAAKQRLVAGRDGKERDYEEADVREDQLNFAGKGGVLPRAPWRSPQEFRRLMTEGLCVRCAGNGHTAKSCPSFRRAKLPRVQTGAALITNEGVEEQAGNVNAERCHGLNKSAYAAK